MRTMAGLPIPLERNRPESPKFLPRASDVNWTSCALTYRVMLISSKGKRC